MESRAFVPRFLARLRVAGEQYEDPRVESVLALSRLFLALTSLLAWRLRLSSPGSSYRLGLLLLIGYTLHALVLFALLPRNQQPGRGFVLWAQISDVAWPTMLCLFADPPNSVFYIFFLFALLAAAFRWGFAETMLTAEISAGLLLLQAAGVEFGTARLRDLLYTSISISRIIMRCGFLLLSGFLLGILAETEKELRAEITLSNRLLSSARVGVRLSEAIHEVLGELGRVFASRDLYDVVCQVSTGRAYKWELPPEPASPLRVQELTAAQRDAAVMKTYPQTFYIERHKHSGRLTVAALDDEGRRVDASRLKALRMPLPDADSVLVISHDIGRDWSGRLVVVNGRLGRRRERELRFAQNILRQVGPAIYSVYLFRRLRSQAGATERARVARELHDTSIQSLISIEMQMDVLRRRAQADAALAGELERIETLLRQEVLNLRELMQAMRPIEIGPHQFLDFIAQIVERFSRDTGMEARFLSDLTEVTMPARTCRELARVVQEGLVNIRKHSGAHSAVVRFAARNGCWSLVIDDDGQGFPFAGRYTLAELDDFHRGPTVIKERVRAAGGDMVLESTPGRGSKLEIIVPQKGHETYG